MAFYVGAFQVDAFQPGDTEGVIVEPPVPPPPPSGGGILAGRSSGRWVRISDGSEVHLRADDVVIHVLVDRVAVGAESIDATTGIFIDPVAVGAIIHLDAAESATHVRVDAAVLGRDDLPEVLRLVRMTSQAPKSVPTVASDVRGIWSLIDRMKGKKS